jgi:hypothetical protein
MFDEQPDSDPHGECAAEIHRLRDALESVRQYGYDTLSGRVDGPDDREWQRAAVLEMTKRARLALEAHAPAEQVQEDAGCVVHGSAHPCEECAADMQDEQARQAIALTVPPEQFEASIDRSMQERHARLHSWNPEPPCWLVERRAEGRTVGYLGHANGSYEWMPTPDKATRFVRREDANGVAECMETEEVIVAEHIWG